MGVNVCNPCCCCCNMEPRTSCFIIGFLELVVELVIGILIAACLMMTSGGEKLAGHDLNVWIIVGAILLLPLVLSFVFSITLLVGLYENKPKLVLAYIKSRYAVLGLWITAIFILRLPFAGPTWSPASISIGVITLVVQFYFLAVVEWYRISMAPAPAPASVSPA